jgi:O-antigen ligase
VTFADRTVVGAIVFMYVAIPLYGTFEVFDPVRLPIPALVSTPGAVGIALAMLLAAAICTWGSFRRPAPRRIVLAQLLAGAAIIPAALLGFDPVTGSELALIVLAMGIVGVAVYGYSVLPGVTRTIVVAWLGSATLAAGTACAMILSRNPAALYAYDNGRAVGTFLNPNELAAYLLVVLGLAAGIAAYARSGPLRVLAGVTLIAGVLALGATYSRWGVVSAVAGLLFFALLVRSRRIWIGLGVVAVLAGVLVVAGPGEAEHHNPRDDTSRIVAWTTGVRTWLAFPLTGVGPLAFRRTYDVLRPPEAPGGEAPVAFDPHSLPLAYLDESGLVGLIALLWCWSVYVREIPRVLRDAGTRRRALVYALAGGLIALNVHVLVNTISIYFALATQGAALALALAQRDLDAPAA